MDKYEGLLKLLMKFNKFEFAITAVDRQAKLYLPENVKNNDVYFSTSSTSDVTVTWSGRNRPTQTASLVGFKEGDITPEKAQHIHAS